MLVCGVQTQLKLGGGGRGEGYDGCMGRVLTRKVKK